MNDGFEAFMGRCRPGLMVPVTREVLLDGDTAVSAFSKLHRGPWGFLLESLEGGERWARYAFLSTEPEEVYRYTGRHCQRWTATTGWTDIGGDVNPLEHLGALVKDRSGAAVPGLPPFTGGAVGFIGYDVVRTLEDLPDSPADDRGLPDAVMMIAGTVLVLDNVYNRATVISNVRLPRSETADPATLRRLYDAAESRIDSWIERLSAPGSLRPLALDPDPDLPTASSPYPDERFLEGVIRIQQEIAAGETFQTVLSRRLDLTAPDPFLSYRYLRALNPAPYLFYLHCDDVHLVGSSPEVLVRVQDGEITVRPIAGTRPRGANAEADQALEDSLRADPKERAEHLMLVDLGRNDVGRVAEFGSVKLTSFMQVERYSHVMHLVSEVRGRLRQGLDSMAALAAAFPAGTVSGAPKIRAMEIIDSLEPVRRGPYAGAVGYIGWGGQALDTAIAIRTCVFHNGRAFIQAGAGIVADSVPENELRETEAKARAVLVALALAGRGE